MVEAKIVLNASIYSRVNPKDFYLEKVFDFNSHLELCISISTVYEDYFLSKEVSSLRAFFSRHVSKQKINPNFKILPS